jgi:hypothetical protein
VRLATVLIIQFICSSVGHCFGPINAINVQIIKSLVYLINQILTVCFNIIKL